MESQDVAAPVAGVPQNTPAGQAPATAAAAANDCAMATRDGVASAAVRMYVGDDTPDNANCDNVPIQSQDCDREKMQETLDPLASATDGEVTPAQTPRGVTPIPEGSVDDGSQGKLTTKSASSSNLKKRVKKKKTLPRRAKSTDSLDSLGDSEKGHSKLRKIKKINKDCPLHGSQDFLDKIKAGHKAKEIVEKVLKRSKEDAADSGVEDGCAVEQQKVEKVPLSKEDCLCRVVYRSPNADQRPEPEGGAASELSPFLHEYDKIIYSNDPLFSDDDDLDSSINDQVKLEMEKYHQRNPHADVFTSALMVNTNTMFRFAVIATELQNIISGSLKRAEGEVQALTRRIRLLEEDYEQTETRLQTASEKLEEASKAADESERGRKVLENRQINDEERISILEKDLEDTIYHGEEADHKYEEAARKLAVTEVDLERAEARLEAAEAKINELEEELKVVGNNMKSLEISEQEASQREDSYEETIRDLTARLKDAENRATEAERTVSKLQKEVDRLEDELLAEKEKYKGISEELDQTFAELAGF